MRRKDKEIVDRPLIDWIMHQAQVCRLGLCQDNQPYIVPLSFGYDNHKIYFHTATAGTKITIFLAHPQVCFEMEHDVKIIEDEQSPCKWSHSYFSVIGFGTVHEINELDAKKEALNQIMRHYSHKDWSFAGLPLENVRLWAIDISEISGKKSKDKKALNNYNDSV